MSRVPPGYHGQYLRVDLTRRSAVAVPLDEDVLRRFVGGSGLGTWLLLEESRDSFDPLSPDAPVIYAFSPLVGSPLTTSAKFAMVAKSPLTGRINDSLSSSHFAIAGKKTGYDALVIVGAAREWTTLVIDPNGVRFEDAAELQGLSAAETGDRVRANLGPEYRVSAIGLAGENQVRYATVSHDGRHAGRGGMGAVFGSKRLKAVAVRGERIPQFAHPREVVSLSKDLSRKSFGPATAKYRELGTVSNLLTFNRLGMLPTRNFQSGEFEESAALAPESWNAARSRTRASCAACTIGCEHIFEFDNQKRHVRLEYESLFALGSACGIADPEIVLRAAALCDELGFDTISAGVTIAFAMECAERGLIAAPELRFGNGEALLALLREIAARRGLGDLLALGTRAAAARIGQGSDAFAAHVKGLEMPGYEPRGAQLMGLGFAVGTRGADHNRSGAYQVDLSEKSDRLAARPEDVALAIATEDEAAVIDSLILCKFVRGVLEDRYADMADMLGAATGWDMSAEDLRNVGRRVVAARKWFNIRQGWTPAEDTLPERFLSEELPTGASAGARMSRSQLQTLIETYNRLRGWSDDGWIPGEQLVELGIVDREPACAGAILGS